MNNKIFFLALCLSACGIQSEKEKSDLIYNEEKNSGTCEKGFNPIPVSDNSLSFITQGNLDLLPKGNYTLEYTEVFVSVSGQGIKNSYAYTNSANLSRHPCIAIEGLEKVPDFSLILPSFDSYTYKTQNTERNYAAALVTASLGRGSGFPFRMASSSLGQMNGYPKLEQSYSTLKAYYNTSGKIVIRASQQESQNGINFTKTISQTFQFVAE